jgi:hypothetical protein
MLPSAKILVTCFRTVVLDTLERAPLDHGKTHEIADGIYPSRISILLTSRSTSMAQGRTIKRSHTSSLTADLRPAPLRIPQRKAVAGDDHDNAAIATARDHRYGRRGTPTPALSRKDPSHHRQSDITHALPQRRAAGPKLKSLLSRFEILDTANSKDICIAQQLDTPHEAEPSILLLTTGSNQTLQQDLIEHSQEEPPRRTSTIYPHQTRTSSAPGQNSTLPPSTQPMAETPNVIAHVNFNNDPNSGYLGAIDDKAGDIDGYQASGPDPSYSPSGITASPSSWRPG